MTSETSNEIINLELTSVDHNKKIFIGGLNSNTDEQTIRNYVEQFGKIIKCTIMTTAEGKSQGCADIIFEDSSSVEHFMSKQPHIIDNFQVLVKLLWLSTEKKSMNLASPHANVSSTNYLKANPGQPSQPSRESDLTDNKLFVGRLAQGINEKSLQQHFSKFGCITKVLIMKDRNGKSRHFGFVTFESYQAVYKCLQEKKHVINGKHVIVKKAIPKEQIQQQRYERPIRNDPYPQRNSDACPQRPG